MERQLASIRRPLRCKIVIPIVRQLLSLAPANRNLVNISVPVEVRVVCDPLLIRRNRHLLDRLVSGCDLSELQPGSGRKRSAPDVGVCREHTVGEHLPGSIERNRVRIQPGGKPYRIATRSEAAGNPLKVYVATT